MSNGLFGAVKLTKNVNTSNYQYKGYGICFDSGGEFSIGNITNGKNVIIFGADIVLAAVQQIKHEIFMFEEKILLKE